MTNNSFLTGIECNDFDRDVLKSTDCFWDPICGTYSITDNVAQKLDGNIEGKRKIANVLAQKKCRGINVPTAITLDQNGKDKD